MTEQKKNYATKKKGKTETQPLWNMSDIKAVIEWFENNNEWDGYLTTMLELLLGRRVGDTISMKWSDLYHENGRRKEAINTIVEQKTEKVTELPVSSMVYEAIDIYLSHVKINPMEHFNDFIFEYQVKTEWINRKNDPVYECEDIEEWCERFGKDLSDNRKEAILKKFKKQREYKVLGEFLYYEVEWTDVVKWQTDDYRKKLKKAVESIGITSPVSTHTLRKTFGYWIYKMHMFDPNCLLSLQKLFNHADLQTTMIYIGLIEEKKRQYIEDHGDFIRNVLAGKGDEIIKNMPVISLKSDDFGKIIRMLTDDIDKYQAAINMANELRIA
ncbi:MAG: tyrosine-type recombinase/integrase [Fusobacterium necrophorum]|nr:tyrosine-type recombinase/integrase [Fusobacterium necrophorum]